MKTLRLLGFNNYPLSCYLWDNVKDPVGVVQIIHGMQEHARRYTDFAEYLNTQGLIVFASDLRGHGITTMINNEQFGYSDGDIYNEILQDQLILTDYLKEQFHLPISIFAHSFGSFIGQSYIVENGFKIKNIILSGTTYTASFKYKMGYIVSCIGKIFKGKKHKATFIENHTIRQYEKKFPEGNWLSRSEENWYNYTHDPLCALPFPYAFYHSMLKHVRKNYKHLENIPYYLPIMIMSGSLDPVFGKKGIFDLFVTYGKAMKKVLLKTYLNCRHELIHEIDNAEIFNDIATFFKTDTLDYVSVKVENA